MNRHSTSSWPLLSYCFGILSPRKRRPRVSRESRPPARWSPAKFSATGHRHRERQNCQLGAAKDANTSGAAVVDLPRHPCFRNDRRAQHLTGNPTDFGYEGCAFHPREGLIGARNARNHASGRLLSQCPRDADAGPLTSMGGRKVAFVMASRKGDVAVAPAPTYGPGEACQKRDASVLGANQRFRGVEMRNPS